MLYEVITHRAVPQAVPRWFRSGCEPCPTVRDNSPRGERYFDLFSKLLNDRIIVINETIDDHMMGVIVSQLLYLDADDHDEPIHLYISSPGGSVMAGLAILDTMNP